MSKTKNTVKDEVAVTFDANGWKLVSMMIHHALKVQLTLEEFETLANKVRSNKCKVSDLSYKEMQASLLIALDDRIDKALATTKSEKKSNASKSKKRA